MVLDKLVGQTILTDQCEKADSENFDMLIIDNLYKLLLNLACRDTNMALLFLCKSDVCLLNKVLARPVPVRRDSAPRECTDKLSSIKIFL